LVPSGEEPAGVEGKRPARTFKISRFTIFYLFLLAAVVAWSGWTFWRYDQDDAFITYRYARQIASGNGLVYNLNEHVLGTTTPLYTLLLAGFSALSGAGVREFSHALSLAALFAGGMGLYLIGRGQRWIAAAAGLFYVSNPFYQMSVGMETFVFVSLLIYASLAYQRRRRVLTALLLGLAMLVRYEAVLLALLIGLHALWRERRVPWWLAGSLLPLVPWMFYAWQSFGQVVPQSAFAKLSATRIPFLSGLLIWWQVYNNFNPLFFLVPPLALLGLYYAVRKRRIFSPFYLLFAWSLLYSLVCSLIAGSFPWYYGPLIPALSVLCAGGLLCLGETFSLGLRRPAWATTLLSFFIIAAMVVQCLAWRQDGILVGGQVLEGRTLEYRGVIGWLKSHALPGSSLATAEIGVIGYDTDMRIVDLYGLVTTGLDISASSTLARRVESATQLYAPDYFLVEEDAPTEAFLLNSGKYRVVRRFLGQRQPVLYERIP
jgi:hypothetical protein